MRAQTSPEDNAIIVKACWLTVAALTVIGIFSIPKESSAYANYAGCITLWNETNRKFEKLKTEHTDLLRQAKITKIGNKIRFDRDVEYKSMRKIAKRIRQIEDIIQKSKPFQVENKTVCTSSFFNLNQATENLRREIELLKPALAPRARSLI